MDTHAHLDYYDCDSLDIVMKNALNHHVQKIVTVCTKLERVEVLSAIALKYSEVYYSLAQHPCESKLNARECYEFMDDYLNRVIIEERVDTMLSRDVAGECNVMLSRDVARNDVKLVAIGETGLDKNGAENQMEVFDAHLQIARKYKLPVIVHSRDMDEQLIVMLKKYRDVQGVLHCWTGSYEAAVQAIDLGWYISFSGIVTFGKKVEYLCQQVRDLPIDKIVVETDTPYLAPDPVRGRCNEPANVLYVAKKLAELKKCSLESLCESLWKNSERLFEL